MVTEILEVVQAATVDQLVDQEEMAGMAPSQVVEAHQEPRVVAWEVMQLQIPVVVAAEVAAMAVLEEQAMEEMAQQPLILLQEQLVVVVEEEVAEVITVQLDQEIVLVMVAHQQLIQVRVVVVVATV